MSKTKLSRLESDIERCRADHNWERLMELLPTFESTGSGSSAHQLVGLTLGSLGPCAVDFCFGVGLE